MLPRLDDPEVAMKLALVGTLRDDLVGEDLIADYLLYTLNKQRQFRSENHSSSPALNTHLLASLHDWDHTKP